MYCIILYYIIYIYILLHCIILMYYIVLYYILLYCIVLHYITFYYIVLYWIISYIIVWYIMLYHIISYDIYYIIFYYILLCYIILCYIRLYYQRKFRSETSDNMDSWKAEVRRVRWEKIRRKKVQVRETVGTSRNTVFFQWFVAPEGRKVGSLKRRVRSELARWEMKNCTPLWREAHFQVKMYKTHQLRTTFGSWDVEKVHAVVARSTFPSQNVQNTPFSDHFWKLKCRKSARRCGAKHISKSKCTKHTRFGPLLEVEMSKKCTPLWREAHFQVKMYKTHHARTTFGSCDVEKVHAAVARSTFPSQKCQKLRVLSLFWH